MFQSTRTVAYCSLVSRSFKSALRTLCVMSAFPCLVTAQKNVVSLSASFDIDGDGFSEFLALEKQSPHDLSPSSAAFYEIDEFGFHTELWRHTTPRHIVTAEVGDLDGDGSPEILVLSRSSSLGAGADDPPWLKVFRWAGFDFSPSPSISLSGIRDSERLRPSGIALIDFDMDGTDEISFAQASPQRSLSVNSLPGTGALEEASALSSAAISSGYGHIHLVETDYNNDSAPDLMALSPEASRVWLQVFTNRDGQISMGPSAAPSYPSGTAAPIGLIPSGMASVDIDDDNSDEILLPFESGSVLALKQIGSDFALIPVGGDVASLFQFPSSLTELDIDNILLGRAELGMTGTLKQMNLNALPVAAVDVEPEVPSAPPVPEPEIAAVEPEPTVAEPEASSRPSIGTMRLSAVPVATAQATVQDDEASPARVGLTGRVQRADLASVNRETGEVSPRRGATASSASGRMTQISLSTLGGAPGGPAAVSDTAYVETPFIYPVAPSSGTMATFRKIMFPDGARFNPNSRNIEWTPTPSQVGFHRFEFQIVVQGGGSRPDVQEVRGQGVTVRSTSKIEAFQFTVVVLE